MTDVKHSSDSVVVRLLKGADRPEPVEIAQALAGVEAALFGTGSGPVRLARYILLDRLGAGGAGVVYSAFDPELDRRVAIKLLHPRGSGTISARRAREALVREARALARLSHPNVVAVYDVGTFDASAFSDQFPPGGHGRQDGLFLVMELVGETNLSQWLASAPPRDAIVHAFVEAGRGLAAAHAAGVIHRDFKPANVLVGEDGSVRVVDFGLARWGPVVSPDGDEATVEGTPRYMAPEQHAGAELDARADQYAFCVSLYEALYGRPPFAGKTFDQLAEAKQKPVVVPAETSGVPHWQFEVLRRGLDPDPERRFPSMDDLLEALERTPLRRRRRVVLAAGVMAVIAAALGGRAVSKQAAVNACDDQSALLSGVWDADRRAAIEAAFEATGRPFARATFATVAANLDNYVESWAAARSGACRDALEASTPSGSTERRFLCLDRGLHRLTEVTRLLAAADAEVVERGVSTVQTLEDPALCARVGALEDEVEPEILASLDVAESLVAAGRYREALERADGARRASSSPAPLARARLLLGVAHRELGETDVAEEDLFEAVVEAERANRAEIAAEALVALARLQRVRDGMGHTPRRWIYLAEAKLAGLGVPPTDLTADLHVERAAQAWDEARYEDALRELDAALTLREKLHGEASPELAEVHVLRGQVLYKQRRFADSRRELERAVDAWAASVGERHPAVAIAYRWLGNIAWRQGRYDEALAFHRQGLEIIQDSLGEEHPSAALAMMGVSNVLTTMKRREEALDVQRRAVAILRKARGPDHRDLAANLTNLAVRLNALKRHAQAMEAAEEAIGIWDRLGSDVLPAQAYPYLELSRASRQLGRPDDALRYAHRAAEIWVDTLGPGHPKMTWAHAALGRALLARGDREDAVVALEMALDLFDPDVDDPRTRAAIELDLARAQVTTDRQGAFARARWALRTYRSLPYAAEEVAEVETWLMSHGAGVE